MENWHRWAFENRFIYTYKRNLNLKLSRKVLVGHSDAVLTVAVSVNNKSQVISGSKDCNLIVWDISTGEEIHTLAGHLGPVTCVNLSADGKEKITM